MDYMSEIRYDGHCMFVKEINNKISKESNDMKE